MRQEDPKLENNQFCVTNPRKWGQGMEEEESEQETRMINSLFIGTRER